MDRTNRYLLSQFISTFGSLFFTLFFITSVVYFIQIARITSVIKITFLELGKLYMFLLPKVFIFTLPFSFFIAIAFALFRLSRENEMTVLFTFGYNPRNIAKFFLFLASLLSFFLVINALFLMPLSTNLQTNFMDYKKAEAKFNIAVTEFGQKFSDWFVFVNDAGKDHYEKIILYSKYDDEDVIISASEASIKNKSGEINLELNNGKAYKVMNNSIDQLDFKVMLMRTLLNANMNENIGILSYWQDIFIHSGRAKDFVLYLSIALFPLASTLFALSFGIVMYRYEKTSVYFGLAGVVLAYFAAITIFGRMHPMWSLGGIFLLFFTLSLIVFKQKILKRF